MIHCLMSAEGGAAILPAMVNAPPNKESRQHHQREERRGERQQP